jgi:WD40 repeat protein
MAGATLNTQRPGSPLQNHPDSPQPGKETKVTRVAQEAIQSSVASTNEIPKIYRTTFENNNHHLLTSISSNGQRIATVYREGLFATVNIRDASSGQFLANHHHDGTKISSIGLSPNGIMIAYGTGNGSVEVWSTEPASPIFSLVTSEKPTGTISSISWSSDESRMIASSTNGKTYIWNIQTKTCETTIENATNTGLAVISPKGNIVAVSCQKGRIAIYEIPSGKLLNQLMSRDDRTSEIISLCFSPDGTQIALGCEDSKIRILDIQSSKLTCILTGHRDEVSCVAFNSRGTQIVSGSRDGSTKIWDVESSKCSLSFQETQDQITSAAFHSDGTNVISVSIHPTTNTRKWNLESGKCSGIASLQGWEIPRSEHSWNRRDLKACLISIIAIVLAIFSGYPAISKVGSITDSLTGRSITDRK